MNILFFGWMIALVIWGVVYEWKFIALYIGLMLFYHIVQSILLRKVKPTIRQKISSLSWGETGNPTIFAKIEVDCDKVDKFLEEYNHKNPDKKLSYTIIGIKSLGEMMKKGSFSKCLRFGNVVNIDPKLVVLVDVDGKQLAQLPVPNIDKLGMVGIKTYLKGRIQKFKNKQDKDFNHQLKIIKVIPAFLIQVLFYFSHFISYSFKRAFPIFKIQKEYFGSGILTNVSQLNCSDVFAPRIEFCNTNFLMVIATPEQKAVPVNGEVGIKKIMLLNMTFDSRFSIGDDIIHAVKDIEKVWKNPEQYL